MLDRLITERGRLYLVLRSTARGASPSPYASSPPPRGRGSVRDISQCAEGRQSVPRGVSVGALRDIPQQHEAEQLGAGEKSGSLVQRPHVAG